MTKLTKVALALTSAAMLALLVACPQPTNEDPKIEQQFEVGDELAGGFVVSFVDDAGGYIANRDFDENDDGDMLDADDQVQRLVEGRFYSDLSFTADKVWYLGGAVFIGDNDSKGNTLTIAEGTLIKGESSSTAPGMLVITRGSKIEAVGSAAKPIVFTSARAEGSRAPGDWGGIIINGKARVQKGTAEGEGSTGEYGGTNDADDSGTLKYVRVEFAGTLFTPDNELNGIAFQAVGSGTEVDYVQVHQNGDDGVEFFGGSVAVKHLVLTGNNDDSLDFDDGWNGSAQFVIIQQYPGNDHGIEGDGDALDVFAPANPILANFTIVSNTTCDDGMNLKEAAVPTLHNIIVANVPAAETSITEGTVGTTTAAGTVVYNGVLVTTAVKAGTDWVAGTANAQLADFAATNLPAGAIATATAGVWSFDFVPTAAPATVVATTIPAADPAGNLLTAAAYYGAVEPAAATAWYAGWTAFPEK